MKSSVIAGGHLVLRCVLLVTSVLLSAFLPCSRPAYAATTPSLIAILITPLATSVGVNSTVQLTATGVYNNLTISNLTSQVSWTSGNPATVSVAANGLGLAVAAGTTTVSAKLGSVSSLPALVTAVSLTSISITPATVKLALNGTQQYTATGKYSNGTTSNITSSVTWKSASPSVVGLSSAGLATDLARSGSTVAVTASLGSITSNTSVVTPAPAVKSLAITPKTVTIPLNGTSQYTATATYTDGTTANVTSSVSWASSAPSVVSLSGSGLATDLAASASAVNVTASLSGVTSNTSVVTPAPAIKSLAITPGAVTMALNGTSQYTATATYSNGSTANVTSSVSWVSSAPAVVSVSGSGLATDLAASAGTVSVTASLNGVTSNSSVVTPPPALQSIAISPPSSPIASGGKQQYAATGTYSNGTTANLTNSVTWTSSAPSVVSISSTGLATALSALTGPVTITASSGSVASPASTLSPAATLTSIAITPASVSLGLGATQQYTATGNFSDGTTANLTNSVTWTSGTPSVATISSAGLASVVATSSSAVAITATSGSITSSPSWLSALSSLPRVCSSPTIDMRLLVVTNGHTEADFPAILQLLNYVGTPYTVLDFQANPAQLTSSMLSDGACHGFFQGVIFASGGYIYALQNMPLLTSYEQTFHVRQVNWYTYPGSDFGFNAPTGSVPSTQTYSAKFTSAAKPVFFYANTATPLAISNAAVYLAQPLTAPPSGATVTPLLTDSQGNALSVIYNFGDGRQYLTQTFDSNASLTHDLVLAYGLLNWVTQGVFLGQYHVYAAAQVDDFFINDSEWIPGTPCTDPITGDRTPPDSSTLPTFRLTPNDMTSLVNWQNSLQTDPITAGFKLTLAFNGVGTTGNKDWTGLASSGVTNDPLTSNVQNYQAAFHWISHTFDHPGTLNGLHKSDTGGDPDTPKVDDIDMEILTNMFVANGTGKMLDTDSSDTVSVLHLTDFNPGNIVTPGVTGLNDPNVPSYLYSDGIRFAVSDTSVATVTNPPNNNGPNPSPNVGYANSYAPGIYEVPRHPNDVFYNAANWNDDQAEFACLYNTQPPFSTYTGPQILDFVSSGFLTNMLMGDIDPQMFHQPNLHDYDGSGHSLIADTYSATFQKYEALYNLPVLNLTLDQIGTAMQARSAYNAAGVTGSLIGQFGTAQQVTLTMPAGSTVPSASIPVTGVAGAGAESYGGQQISHIPLTAGQTVTLPTN